MFATPRISRCTSDLPFLNQIKCVLNENIILGGGQLSNDVTDSLSFTGLIPRFKRVELLHLQRRRLSACVNGWKGTLERMCERQLDGLTPNNPRCLNKAT